MKSQSQNPECMYNTLYERIYPVSRLNTLHPKGGVHAFKESIYRGPYMMVLLSTQNTC